MSTDSKTSRQKDSRAASPGNDCYSAGERSWMERGQQIRAVLLGPLLRWLTALRVMPDHVTVLAMISGVAFAPAWLVGFPWLALLLLTLHVVLDGLDGPLARYQAVASPRGSFTDTFCDQVVLTTVTITLMVGAERWLGIVPGAIFLVLYTAVVAVAMVRNALNIPYRWLVRPRFFFYAAIVLQLLGIPHAVTVVIWASNVLLAIKIPTGFLRLRDQLPGPRG